MLKRGDLSVTKISDTFNYDPKNSHLPVQGSIGEFAECYGEKIKYIFNFIRELNTNARHLFSIFAVPLPIINMVMRFVECY